MSVALLALAIAAAPADAREMDIAAIRELKLEEWPGFYRRQDAAGLSAFLHDDFVNFGPDGSAESKADAVAWARANAWPNATRRFEYVISGIAFHGPDTANVYGVGSFDGPTCRMRYSSANILTREDGRWRPRFSHTSAPICTKAAS